MMAKEKALSATAERALIWFAELPGGRSFGDTRAKLAAHLHCDQITAANAILELETRGFIQPMGKEGLN